MKEDKKPFLFSKHFLPLKAPVVPIPLPMMSNPPFYPLPVKTINRKIE